MVFTERVRATKLPLDEVIVVGSGLLDQLGYRTAADVDLSASPRLFKSLERNTQFVPDSSYGHAHYLFDDGAAEVWPYWIDLASDTPFAYEALCENIMVIDGVRFITPQFLLMWKCRANREKDKPDIAFLEAYLAEDKGAMKS